MEVTELKAPPELEIADVCYDSRRAAADTLFVAVRGFGVKAQYWSSIFIKG